MSKEYDRKKRIADLASQFYTITNGSYEIIKYKENRTDKVTGKDLSDILLASIPLIEHPIYGETKIHILEQYDKDDLLQYHYGWEKIKGSKHTKHISAWGNEPHDDGGYWSVENTEPWHHHHIPEEPSYRKDCYHVRSLEVVLKFVEEFIIYKQEYHQDINT